MTAALALSLMSVPAMALTASESAVVDRAEDWFNSVSTLSADFVQTGQTGERTSGHMLLKRPGLIRFDYAPPAQVLLISNGTFVTFVDYEVGQETSWPLFDTPLSYLVRESVDLERDALVDEVETADNQTSFRLRAPDNPEQGSITLYFRDAPFRLDGWSVTDAQGQRTTVALFDTVTNETLPAGSFLYDKPVESWKGNR
ncbi:MAG: outer membrane lipoprotein carrier protein LolA [Pseudomonadota bacterium]|nr:outer membrane lipoprotein carrier protein LolA [Pseudomonadota bacterium]